MSFGKRVASKQQLLIAELCPALSATADDVRSVAKSYAGKVHALGVSENRNGVSMSALAAASLAAAQGVEPILHLATRDRNRIALISECLGASAIGITTILCTSGTHQTLGRFGKARNVSDIDPVQLLRALSDLAKDGALIGESSVANGGFCLGAVASPYADPMEMQIMRLEKKLAAGATFLVTQAVFDQNRFRSWWEAVAEKGLPRQAAIIARIHVLSGAKEAEALAAARPSPALGAAILERLSAAVGASEQRATGIRIAIETIEALSSLAGLRGFEICTDGDHTAALEVIKNTGIKV